MRLGDVQNVVVIGGGQAGAQTCFSLRQWGFDGRISLICDEPVPPYQRPPLSKDYLKGALEKERLFFKPESWYADNDVNLMLSTQATRIDRSTRTIEIKQGASLPYDAVVLATGSRPRPLPLPGADLENVFELRSMADIEQLSPKMITGQRMVIVGAGYIGLEAAAVARHMELEVTVLEMADRVLARVTSPLMSDFYTKEHGAQGVDIRCNARLAKLTGDGAVSAAVLDDGSEIPADLVLVGIGILPNQDLAADAGIACDNGIIVDEDARTNDPRVFAAGDCTQRPLIHYGGRRSRLESVHNAIEQGKLAAAAILGRDRPPIEAPWFWSDQYDLKLQIAGLSTGYDEIALRGAPDDRKFAAFYLRNGTLIAVDAVNSGPEFMAAKRMIAAGARLAPEQLADMSVSMKDLMKQVT